MQMIAEFLPQIRIALAIISAVLGIIASVYWFRSSRVHSPDYDKDSVKQYERESYNWMKESSLLNGRAALWTAAAVAVAAVSAISGVLS